MSVPTTLDPRSPTTTRPLDTRTTEVTTSALTREESSRADTSLRQLEQIADEHAVDALLQGFLARRRAVRRARREQAIRQARHENELLMQRALLGTGLGHLR